MHDYSLYSEGVARHSSIAGARVEAGVDGQQRLEAGAVRSGGERQGNEATRGWAPSAKHAVAHLAAVFAPAMAHPSALHAPPAPTLPAPCPSWPWWMYTRLMWPSQQSVRQRCSLGLP